jgi:hypothetical protein
VIAGKEKSGSAVQPGAKPSETGFMLYPPPLLRSEEQLLNTHTSGALSAEYLTSLVYELLDAHSDTISLAGELPCDQRWAAHVDYLQALQRVGREALARVAS